MIIYKITNNINGKSYIGLTTQVNYKSRWTCHKHLSRNLKNNKSSVLHKAISKYGEDNFKWEVIDDSAKTVEELNDLEIKYIEEVGTLIPNGYNVQLGGFSGLHNEETKKKMKRSKHFPIDCKCMKTGVTYSFYNATEVEELGFVQQTVLGAVASFRMSKNFYWKKRHEEFPKCIETWHRERFFKSNKKEQLDEHTITSNKMDSRKSVRYRSDGKPVIDNNGNFYTSIAEACRSTGAYHAGVRAVIRGERRTAAGLSFRYATSEEVNNYEW